MAGKGDALLGDLPQAGQGENLEAAGVREDGTVPVHEPVQAAHLPHHVVAGAQMQVIGVGQLDLAAQIVKVEGVHAALDGGLGAHVHEYRRLHRAAVGTAELAPPGPALFFDYFEHSFSLNRQTSVLPDASYFTGPIIANPAEYFNSPVFGRESAKKCAALLTRRSQRIIVKLMNIS